VDESDPHDPHYPLEAQLVRSGHQELYDLSSDPQEARNLAGEARFSKVKGELESRLNAWRGPIASTARAGLHFPPNHG
jgi:hypothetical protein